MVDIAALWRTTLERLASRPVDAVARTWLQEAQLSHTPHVDVDDIDAPLTAENPSLHFMLEVPSDQARDVIQTRWRRSLEAILMEVTGQPTTISITYNGAGEDATPRDSAREVLSHTSLAVLG